MSPENWIQHDGGPMPVTAQTKVKVRFKNGTVSPWLAAKFHPWVPWRTDAPGYDVAAYQVKPRHAAAYIADNQSKEG
jgi:hypothetical protein